MQLGKISRRQLFKGFGLTSGIAGLLSGSSIARAVAGACGLTPPQTEGPFYPVKDQADKDSDLTIVRGATERAKGQVIYVQGKVTDEHCVPVSRALVEIWQACKSGRYNHPGDESGQPLDPNFQYWGKAVTDEQGKYTFKTILPGHYQASPAWIRPPHIHYKVYARGFFDLTTQMYFAGNPYNEKDLILKALPVEERQRVLVTLRDAGATFEPGSQWGTFDITLRRVRG